MKKETKIKLAEIQAQQDIANFSADLNRARSVTVGTAFGGVSEISMRSHSGQTIWCLMQPVEVIELVHQLAASVGCHIHMQPRKDFSSWRNWKHTEEELAHYHKPHALQGSGHAPHVNDMAPHQDKGQVLPPPEKQPGMQLNRSNNYVMATKKTVNKRSAKRATKAP